MLPEVSVFARVTPAHKARIVSCLRRAGRGGGGHRRRRQRRSRDPARRRRHRARLARHPGGPRGRRRRRHRRPHRDDRRRDRRGPGHVASVRDALSILLGGNLGEIVFTVASSLIAGRSALNARQLLLVNLLTDMLPAIALRRRPRAQPGETARRGPGGLARRLAHPRHLPARRRHRARGRRRLVDRAGDRHAGAGEHDRTGRAGGGAAAPDPGHGQPGSYCRAGRPWVSRRTGPTVSIPGLSRFFGCRPLGPVGWSVALGSAGAATLVGMMIEPMNARCHGCSLIGN